MFSVFVFMCLIATGYLYWWNTVGIYQQQATVLQESISPIPEQIEPVTAVQEQYTAPQREVIYVTATPTPTQLPQQVKSYAYEEPKIDCSYNDGKYSYDYGKLTYSECQMKANAYFAQERAKIPNTNSVGSYQSQPVNVQFNNPPAAPTVPVGYGYSN